MFFENIHVIKNTHKVLAVRHGIYLAILRFYCFQKGRNRFFYKRLIRQIHAVSCFCTFKKCLGRRFSVKYHRDISCCHTCCKNLVTIRHSIDFYCNIRVFFMEFFSGISISLLCSLLLLLVKEFNCDILTSTFRSSFRTCLSRCPGSFLLRLRTSCFFTASSAAGKHPGCHTAC